MISAYTQSVCGNRMNKIKSKHLAREKKLMTKFLEHFNLERTDQIENLEYFCVDIGFYTVEPYYSSYFLLAVSFHIINLAPVSHSLFQNLHPRE